MPERITVAELVAELRAVDAGYTRGLKQAEDQVTRFGKSSRTVGREVRSFGDDIARTGPVVRNLAQNFDQMGVTSRTVGNDVKQVGRVFNDLGAQAKTAGNGVSVLDAGLMKAKDSGEKVGQTTRKVTDSMNGLERNAQQLGTQLAAPFLQSEQAMSRWRNGITAAGLAIGGVATVAGTAFSVGLGKFVQSGMEMNKVLETSTLQFKTLMGSADQAHEHVKMLFEFAKLTPYETGPVIQASRLLQTFGKDQLNTADNLRMVGDAAAATQTSFEEIAFWVGRSYSMIKGGRPFGEAALRLQELAVLTPEARQKMESLQEQGKEWSEVWKVMTNDLGRFNGAMKEQAATWGGLTSTLKDTMAIGAATAFEPLFLGMKKILKAAVEFTESDVWNDFVAIAREKIGQVVKKLDEFYETGKKIASKFNLSTVFDQLSNLREYLKTLTPILSGLGVALSTSFLNTLPVLRYFLPNISVITQALIGMTAGILVGTKEGRAALKQLQATFKDLAQEVGPSLGKVTIAIADAMTAIVPALADMAAALVKIASPALLAFLEGVTPLVVGFAKAVSGLLDVLNPLADLIGSNDAVALVFAATLGTVLIPRLIAAKVATRAMTAEMALAQSTAQAGMLGRTASIFQSIGTAATTAGLAVAAYAEKVIQATRASGALAGAATAFSGLQKAMLASVGAGTAITGMLAGIAVGATLALKRLDSMRDSARQAAEDNIKGFDQKKVDFDSGNDLTAAIDRARAKLDRDRATLAEREGRLANRGMGPGGTGLTVGGVLGAIGINDSSVQQARIQANRSEEVYARLLGKYANFTANWTSITKRLKKNFGPEAAIDMRSLSKLAADFNIDLTRGGEAGGVAVDKLMGKIKNLATQAGFTGTSINDFMKKSKNEMQELAQAGAEMSDGVRKAFESFTDPIKGLGGLEVLNPETMKKWFDETTFIAQKFVSNISNLLARGLDPQFVSKLLQAGPAEGGRIAEAMVNDHTGNMIAIANAGLEQIKRVNQIAIETARLTSIATADKTGEVSKNFTTAQTMMSLRFSLAGPNGEVPSLETIAKAMGMETEAGRAVLQMVIRQYGLSEIQTEWERGIHAMSEAANDMVVGFAASFGENIIPKGGSRVGKTLIDAVIGDLDASRGELKAVWDTITTEGMTLEAAEVELAKQGFEFLPGEVAQIVEAMNAEWAKYHPEVPPPDMAKIRSFQQGPWAQYFNDLKSSGAQSMQRAMEVVNSNMAEGLGVMSIIAREEGKVTAEAIADEMGLGVPKVQAIIEAITGEIAALEGTSPIDITVNMNDKNLMLTGQQMRDLVAAWPTSLTTDVRVEDPQNVQQWWEDLKPKIDDIPALKETFAKIKDPQVALQWWRELMTRIDEIPESTPTEVRLLGDAALKIARIKVDLDDLRRQKEVNLFINTFERITTTKTGPQGGFATSKQSNANGGFIRFADGGMYATRPPAEHHLAQIAKPGTWRVWAEPETGGEAYIPLAPRKRARSTRILQQVADLFGLDMQRRDQAQAPRPTRAPVRPSEPIQPSSGTQGAMKSSRAVQGDHAALVTPRLIEPSPSASAVRSARPPAPPALPPIVITPQVRLQHSETLDRSHPHHVEPARRINPKAPPVMGSPPISADLDRPRAAVREAMSTPVPRSPLPRRTPTPIRHLAQGGILGPVIRPVRAMADGGYTWQVTPQPQRWIVAQPQVQWVNTRQSQPRQTWIAAKAHRDAARLTQQRQDVASATVHLANVAATSGTPGITPQAAQAEAPTRLTDLSSPQVVMSGGGGEVHNHYDIDVTVPRGGEAAAGASIVDAIVKYEKKNGDRWRR